jgi:hypothetical protein
MSRPRSINEREKKVTSFNIYTDTKHKVGYISLIDSIDITQIVEQALNDYIDKWEKKNGKVPERQTKKPTK